MERDYHGRFLKGHRVNIGRIPTEETRRKISVANSVPRPSMIGHPPTGPKKHTEKTKSLISKKLSGRKMSPEHYQKTMSRFFKSGEGNIMYRAGSNHPNYIDGRTPKSKSRLITIEWKELRKKVYERDNWACTKCGKHGGHLDCHHIIPWSIGGPDSMDNLTTLCPPCHIKTEWEEGVFSGRF